jgi:hypothetical protein
LTGTEEVWVAADFVFFILTNGLKFSSIDGLSCSVFGLLLPKNRDGLVALEATLGCCAETVGLGVALVDGPPSVGVKVVALGFGLNSNGRALTFNRFAALICGPEAAESA